MIENDPYAIALLVAAVLVSGTIITLLWLILARLPKTKPTADILTIGGLEGQAITKVADQMEERFDEYVEMDRVIEVLQKNR